MSNCCQESRNEVCGSLRIHTQAGATATNMKDILDGCIPVWHCKGGITNILLLSNIKNSKG